MAGRGPLVSAVVAVVLGTALVQDAGAREATKMRTLLTMKSPIRAFAQEPGRIAWISRKWHVDVRGTGRRPKTRLVGTAHPFGNGNGAAPLQIALAGGRILWTRHGGGNNLETSVWVRKLSGRHSPRMVFLTAANRDGGPGGYFSTVAGAASTLAFTAVDYECVDPNDCTELEEQPSPLGGVFRVAGTSRSAQLPVVPGASELAVSGNRIALLPAPQQVLATEISAGSAPPPAAAGTTVEIRDAATGALVAQFTPPGTVRALALSGTVAAVVDGLGNGMTAIERYDPTTGNLLGATIGVAAGDTLSLSGHTIVYAVGTQIEAMDAVTGTQRVLADSPAPPIGLSIAGKRVAWAVNAHGHGHVLTLTLR